MDAVAHLNASLAGRYAVDREIGRGGMATVYLARDLRHNRRVALKVLNPELGAVLGVSRFLAEIQVTANLQHPNLLPLFDSGEAEGLLFYVMPYVEGESLRARLNRERQLPIDDAVHLATAVASALDYAHRNGIIHRDLKPENILLHEGQPLVADFGLALAVTNAGGGRITQTGVSLGTPQYMSPEQATGDRVIDARSDVYSLGAVLYEMLTGEPPHSGTTAQAIIARVLTDRPRPIRHSRETVPASIEAAVDRALAKVPADRFASAQEFADAILGKSVVVPADVVTPSSLRSARISRARRFARAWPVWIPWMAVAVLASWLIVSRPTPPTPPTTRFTLSLPPTARLLTTVGGFVEMSPTGAGFVYVGQSPNGPRLFYRGMNEEEPRPIPGTDNAAQPFMSPDGEWVGFILDGRIRKTSLRSGTSETVAELGQVSPAGFAWGADGRIVFGRLGGGLMAVSERGGIPAPLTDLDSAETSHRGPVYLADGRTVAFLTWRTSADDVRIAFLDDESRVTRTTQVAMRARQVAPDLLAFSNSQGIIFGARFNPKTFDIGAPVPVEHGAFLRASGFTAWGASVNGSMVMLRGEPFSRLQLVDRTGVATPLAVDARAFGRPRVSPDGSRIAVHVGVGGPFTGDIWVYSFASQTLTRLTFDGGNSDVLWSRDGSQLVFSGRASTASPETDLYLVNADGVSAARRILTAPGRQWAQGWSGNGADSLLIVEELTRGSITRIVALRPGDTVTTTLVQAPTGAITRFPSVSPDGRWLAYASNESGRMEVYVTDLPRPRNKWQVSTAGGDEPLWSRNGRELFFRDTSHVVAARVATTPTFSILSRARLFEDGYVRSGTLSWDVLADDRRFVMLRGTDESAQVVVITNWGDHIRRLLPP